MSKDLKRFVKFLKNMGVKQYSGSDQGELSFSVSFFEETEKEQTNLVKKEQEEPVDLMGLINKAKESVKERSKHVPEEIKKINILFEAAGIKLNE